MLPARVGGVARKTLADAQGRIAYTTVGALGSIRVLAGDAGEELVHAEAGIHTKIIRLGRWVGILAKVGFCPVGTDVSANGVDLCVDRESYGEVYNKALDDAVERAICALRATFISPCTRLTYKKRAQQKIKNRVILPRSAFHEVQRHSGRRALGNGLRHCV